jgi:hypothetical protein
VLHDNNVGEISNLPEDLIHETDCAAVVDCFKQTSCNRSEVCLIAKEFNLLKPPDRQVIISKIQRSCNKVAHNMCQLSRSVLCGGVLQGVVPTCASKAALEDCNNYNVFD